MKVGYSSIDITPELGIELSGYGWYLGRKAEGVLDKLYARGVAFDDNDIKMLLINCDLIAIEKGISDYVRQKISEEVGLSRTNIMIVCTHTHTGPATGRLIGCGEPDENYRSNLADLLVTVGRLAFNKFREVVGLKSFEKEIEPISFNRATKGGPLDKFVRGITFSFDEGRPLALLSYGCHPVTRGVLKEVSADYPGKIVKALNDDGFDGVFLTGLCGDINPLTHKGMSGGGTTQIITEYGRRIVDGMIYSIAEVEPMKNIKLDAFEIDITLNLQQYKDKEIDEQVKIYESNKEKNPGIFKAVQIWSEAMKERLQKDENPYLEKATMQIFRIGDTAIIGFPGEVFTLIGTIIRKAVPYMNILAVGNANSTMRYVPTRDDIENNGYAGLSSCFLYQRLPLKPGEGEHMAEIVADAVMKRLI